MSGNGRAVKEAKREVAARFSIAERDRVAQLSQVICAVNRRSFRGFRGAKVVFSGRQTVELEPAGTVGSRCGPTAGRARER